MKGTRGKIDGSRLEYVIQNGAFGDQRVECADGFSVSVIAG